LGAIKFLYKNPDMIKKMGENLYNTVVKKYHIDVVTDTRAEFYKSLVNGYEKKIEEVVKHANA
jgi:hypothetical protein